MRNATVPLLTLAAVCFAVSCAAQEPAAKEESKETKTKSSIPDPFEGLYQAYDPGFRFSDRTTEEEKKLSSEPKFFTLNLLPESSRAYALVDAAREKEAEGRYREALDIYQKVIDEYPDMLYRVSEFGIFVPITQYCQLRILAFPAEGLTHYRVKNDSRAKESFELARQRNSLEGLAEIRDKMLCTSYGAPSMTTLGFSALDQGHFLEALEYFETVWNHFPDMRQQNPSLAMSIALCRKLLGIGEKSGERYGLIGHWKLDEGSGNKAADSAGRGLDGTVGIPPTWGPGKVGGALRCDGTNGVSVPRSAFLDIGKSGSDFSVSLWLNWEAGSYPNGVFSKRGHPADEMFNLEVAGNTSIKYTIATQSPKWETGVTKTGVGTKKWAHVAFVKEGMEAKVFIDGKLALRDRLNGLVVKNPAGIGIGGGVQGFVDDVRLYDRALLDREVAEFAGAVGTATMTATPTSGEAPLTVEFSAPGAAGDCHWEFGDGESANGPKVRHTYGLGGEYTPLLTVTDPKGPISVARGRVSAKWRGGDEDFAKRMSQVLGEARYDKPIAISQLSSPPHVSADDYLLMRPTTDALGITDPVWDVRMPGSRLDVFVYSQPVVTRNSVIFRQKNIVYCYSMLNGELRWQTDLGGRVTWQNGGERLYPQEDILVQDGMIFAPMFKVGPTLVALEETTGRMKWAYGPMVASNEEESNMRFESAPAGGPMTVYAGYILDNIEGDAHTDTEYGVIAFDSTTGRVKWRRPVCSLRPGQFSAGFAVKRRNKIRSFQSPPLYREGTVYYNTNAGAIAALDALSGRVKWVMRYPYYEGIHDSTRGFGDMRYSHPSPMLWYNQRPVLIGDYLYVIPVDWDSLIKIDRRTGRIVWRKGKGEGILARRTDGGPTYFLGPTRGGELAVVYSFRAVEQNWAGPFEGGGVHLVDPETGKTLWESGDVIEIKNQPCLKYSYGDGNIGFWAFGANGWNYTTTARPFMTADDKVYIGGYFYWEWPFWEWATHLAEISLADRKVTQRRSYIGGTLLSACFNSITHAEDRIKILEDIPHKTDRIKEELKWMKEIKEDTVPVNKYGPFLPFSRVTVERFGTDFELRMGPRMLSMIYNPAQVKTALAGRTDPEGLFARAELAVGDNRLKEAADLMKQCLATISSEDVDFRAAVNQQLFKVNKRLARSGVRSGRSDEELSYCIGMSQTVGTLADEIETMFALSDAYERKAAYAQSARQAQNIVSTYGDYEYPIPSLWGGDLALLMTTAQGVVDGGTKMGAKTMYAEEMSRGMTLMRKGLPLYFSTLSPLDKDLTVRAGEQAAGKLLRLQKLSKEFEALFEKEADKALAGAKAEEQILRLWEYPGTQAAQKVMDTLLATAGKRLGEAGVDLAEETELRKRMWRLADAARICGLKVPDAWTGKLLAPAAGQAEPAMGGGLADRTDNIEEERGTAWLVLERKGRRDIEPDWLFLGGRVKKKFDNKFLLYCMEMSSGKIVWKAQEQRGEQWFDELRLKGKGEEPGFFEAFVYQDTVVVHGLYDVLSFNLKGGKLKWRYQVPFDFEIRQTAMSGDLLVLAGQAETVVLCLGTKDPRGEVVWQEKDVGDLYTEPYFHGDRLVTVRKMPFNVTVRYRSTGKLIGRLNLPDLTLFEDHPLVENGPKEIPFAHDGKDLVVSDGWYYILVDVERIKILWKRLIDENDPTRPPPLRFELGDEYLTVVRQNFDVKTIYMLSRATGEVLWRTDPKDARSPQPIYSMHIHEGKLYGIKPHAGQAFYFVGLDGKTGKDLFPPNEQKGYGGKPDVRLRPGRSGDIVVVEIRDRQDFELKAFSLKDGKLVHTVKVKSAGDFGEHGRASATVQNSKLVLLGKNELKTATKK